MTEPDPVAPPAPPAEPPPPVAAPHPEAPPAAGLTPSRARFRPFSRPEKRGWFPYLFVLGMLLLLAGLVYLKVTPIPWERFRHEAGRFEVEFPSRPSAKLERVPIARGGEVLFQQFLYGTRWEDEFYAIGFLDLEEAPAAEKLDSMFNAMARAQLEEIAAVADHVAMLGVTPWTLDGHPGREARYDVKRGLGVFTTRWLVVGKRVYVLRTGVHAHHAGENDARFLASFTLLR